MRRSAMDDIDSEAVVELPLRLLPGAFISISGHFEVSVLEHLLNDSFRDWHISVLNDNSVEVTVQDNVTETQVNVFCAESASVLSAECRGALT